MVFENEPLRYHVKQELSDYQRGTGLANGKLRVM